MPPSFPIDHSAAVDDHALARDCAIGAAPVVKGNNGVGNGLDPQPPGNPPINDGPGTTRQSGRAKPQGLSAVLREAFSGAPPEQGGASPVLVGHSSAPVACFPFSRRASRGSTRSTSARGDAIDWRRAIREGAHDEPLCCCRCPCGIRSRRRRAARHRTRPRLPRPRACRHNPALRNVRGSERKPSSAPPTPMPPRRAASKPSGLMWRTSKAFSPVRAKRSVPRARAPTPSTC